MTLTGFTLNSEIEESIVLSQSERTAEEDNTDER